MPFQFYAGIGSRETPADILAIMTRVARALDRLGWGLRSGGALGADTAFESGCDSGRKEIYLPWPGYNERTSPFTSPTPEAIQLASQHHPAWERVKQGGRKLHGRNSHIILGYPLNDPVAFVICWTVGGKAVGGTGLGINLATSREIQVYNLARPDHLQIINSWIAEVGT